jgi:hypothetical protein
VVASSIQKGANESDQHTDHYRGNDAIIVKNERVDHWPLGRQLGDIRRDPSRLTIKLSPAQWFARISPAAGPWQAVGPFQETPYGSFRSGHRL